MPLLCERFATSKLRSFEDLAQIGTFGFRGEALASMSYVSCVSVITKRHESDCAWRAAYQDGQLVPLGPGQRAEPEPTAGAVGTTISLENLFYNMPARRAALASSSEEMKHVLAVMQKYALHTAHRGVGWSLRHAGKARPVMAVARDTSIQAVAAMLWSHDLKDVLTPVTAQGSLASPLHPDTPQEYSVTGFVSSGHWASKRAAYIFFLNDRLIELPDLRRAVAAVYAPILPRGSHPWVYLSLTLPQHLVDVNVHPTKEQVAIVGADDLLVHVADQVAATLSAGNTSRSFQVQHAAAVPATPAPSAIVAPPQPSAAAAAGALTPTPQIQPTLADLADFGAGVKRSASATSRDAPSAGSASAASNAADPRKKVRTSHLDRTLQHWYTSQPASASPPTRAPESQAASMAADGAAPGSGSPALRAACGCSHASADAPTRSPGRYDLVAGVSAAAVNAVDYTISGRPTPAQLKERPAAPADHPMPELASVRTLLAQAHAAASADLCDMLATHAFVGVVDAHWSLVQSGTQLLAVNHTVLARELFYQSALKHVGYHYSWELQPTLPLLQLAQQGMQLPHVAQGVAASAAGQAAQAAGAVATLWRQRELLAECFGVKLVDATASETASAGSPGPAWEDVHLAAMPRLVQGFAPRAVALAALPLRLAWGVDWSKETSCFHGIATALAACYADLPPAPAARVDPGVDASDVVARAQQARADGTPVRAVSATPGSAVRSPAHAASDALSTGTAADVSALGGRPGASLDVQPARLESIRRVDAAWEAARHDPWSLPWIIGHVLMPALRAQLWVPAELSAAGHISVLTRTEELYRVFERC